MSHPSEKVIYQENTNYSSVCNTLYLQTEVFILQKPGTAIQIQDSKFEICYLEFQLHYK